MHTLGIDVGFGFTKATNGSKYIIYKSILGDSTDIQYQTNIGTDSSASQLHVTIDNRSFFIGDYAEQQSTIRQFTLDQNKLLTEYVKVLALTAAGSCFDDNSLTINVVSGLPVAYLKRDYKQFKKLLEGRHEITFHLQGGQDVTKDITINKVQMMPQPVGSIFNALMNNTGKIVEKDLVQQKIGVVDIGFRTTDFSIFSKLQYIERSSTTLDTGISKCFSVIADKLRQESGVNIELFKLYKAINSGMIKVHGKEYNIANLRDRVYSHASEAIANDLNRLWSEDWDIDTIIMTGGGAMELAPFLQPLIEGNVIPIPNGIDGRLNNVMGYLKFGNYKWGYEPIVSSSPAPTPKKKDQVFGNTTEEEKNGTGRSWLKR